MKVTLKNARLAFPVLFEPKSVNGEGDPAYSATFILTKDHPSVVVIKGAVEEVGTAKWGSRWTAVKKELVSKDRLVLHDGETKATYEGFDGNLFVTSRNKARPTVVDANRTPLTGADGRPYAGCYVNAVVELWAQDNSYGKRVNASLGGVQFLRDGDAFSGGRPVSADEFEDLSAEDDDSIPF